jgi:hypothetical protein
MASSMRPSRLIEAVDAGFASAQMMQLGFDIRSELSELPLQVDTVDPRNTAVQIVEPGLHRGEVTFAGGQSCDHFVELALDAVEPRVNAAQANQHEFFGFVRLFWGIFDISHGRVPSRSGQGVAWCFEHRPRPAYRTNPADCPGAGTAPAPDHAIARGRAGAGLLAHIVVSKYDDHLPLYRQAEIFARDGVNLETSTLSGWVSAVFTQNRLLSRAVFASSNSGFSELVFPPQHDATFGLRAMFEDVPG